MAGFDEANWRVVVTGRAASEAFVFADRTLHLSRGALFALGGPESLRRLFQEAEAVFRSGFRDQGTRALLPQPVALDPSAADATGESGREEWVELLDGLRFGEPASSGAERDGEIFLPDAGLRLRLPEGFHFRSHVGHCIGAATTSGRLFRVFFRFHGERVVTGDHAGEHDCLDVEDDLPETQADSLAAEQELLARLAGLLEQGSSGRFSMGEAVRVRNHLGVKGRLLEEDGGVTALVALVVTSSGLVSIQGDCGESFPACEREMTDVLESLGGLDDVSLPGMLRVRAEAPPAAEEHTVREFLERLPEGSTDGSREMLLMLNRGFLEERLGPGDRLLLLRRDARPAS